MRTEFEAIGIVVVATAALIVSLEVDGAMRERACEREAKYLVAADGDVATNCQEAVWGTRRKWLPRGRYPSVVQTCHYPLNGEATHSCFEQQAANVQIIGKAR